MATLRLTGTAASPGVGAGAAYLYEEPHEAGSTTGHVLPPEARAAELDRLHRALAAAARELDALSDRVRTGAGATEAAVFEAQALFLQDPALVEPIEAAIASHGRTAVDAATEVLEAAARDLAALDDPYLRGRAADLRDVSRRLLRLLAGTSSTNTPRLPALPTVLIARDLAPSEIASLPRERVRGIVLAEGTATAHAAILARGLGIPMIVGAGSAIRQIAAGQALIVDGDEGTVLVDPGRIEQAAYEQRSRAQAIAHAMPDGEPGPPYRTADGRRVALLANASSVAETSLALENGAEGIGVLRTEFLLAALGSRHGQAPDEEALAEAYGAILQLVGGRPVVVRAMDAGGDKPLPFLDFGHEANPFLGWRGIRVLLDEPALFAMQTRALLRAASRHGTDLRLMLPMISTVDEFVRARRLVQAVCRDERASLAHPLRIGAMIEVPAAALTAAALAREADFFSIGTNDLIQYTLAGDRGNARVAGLCSLRQPAVLRLLQMVVQAAHAAGRTVGICGEAAGDAVALPLLVGLGVDDLSLGPARIPAVRRQLRSLDYGRLQPLAAEACTLATADQVTALLGSSRD